MSFQQQLPQKKTESILGIISTAIALITLAVFTILILAATYIETATPGGMEESPSVLTIFGLFILLVIPVTFIGAVLGFIGIFQSNKRKTFPVSGALLNSLVFGGVSAAILFGLIAQ